MLGGRHTFKKGAHLRGVMKRGDMAVRFNERIRLATCITRAETCVPSFDWAVVTKPWWRGRDVAPDGL